ncbi:hypothetical protein A6A19_06030 [Actinobacillus delphinicola]|uniref:outer membrane protein transport protein n=1 Tax=Actinobacillus delphinicola TaxID=51161 RepID=UPI0024429B87|nr:outer membrane protein transport protein [Actinobacillus delphinicola]MDG6897550.1 hypothetical protein [Actinobacillus delphinicola]
MKQKNAKNLLNVFQKTALAAAVLSLSSVASASAFQLSETSVSGLGRAFAGEAATADNASVVATNPALMTQFKRAEISAGGILFAPNLDVNGEILSTGTKVSDHNIAPAQFVPQFYGVMPINDNFAIGAGINLNYGLTTDYNDNFMAGYLGGHTHIAAVNTNFSAAYRYNNWSFGLGANVVYTRAEIRRNMGYLSELAKQAVNNPGETIANAQKNGVITASQAQQIQAGLKNPIIQQAVQHAAQQINKLQPNSTLVKLRGDNVSFGVNAGITYNFNENNRIGIAYHSPIEVHFKGKFTNSLSDLTSDPVINGLINQELAKQGVIPTNGKEIDGRLKIVLPDYVELAGYDRLTDRWAIGYSAKWTNWSRFDELHATRKATGGTLFTKQEGFKDSWRYAIGTSYDLSDQWTVRTGFAYETSAMGHHYTISIPDTKRYWYTAGATYRPTTNLSIDVGAAYLHGKKSHFTEEANNPIQAASFDVTASAMLYGLNVNYKF